MRPSEARIIYIIKINIVLNIVLNIIFCDTGKALYLDSRRLTI